jgi:putative transposase
VLGELFDPNAEWFLQGHFRPHWSQVGAVVFISFRTHDSIPREVLQRWERGKRDWLQRRGYGPAKHWSVLLPTLTEKDRAEFQKQFHRCREDFLDTCQGRCLLRRPEMARIVADSLLQFDRQRYRLGGFIVMPNHVHLLAAFAAAEAMAFQCDSWLHYTAFRINKAMGEKGKFWQQEPFDHLVRSLEQYEYLRQYIADNPRKAGLKPGEYLFQRYGG